MPIKINLFTQCTNTLKWMTNLSKAAFFHLPYSNFNWI